VSSPAISRRNSTGLHAIGIEAIGVWPIQVFKPQVVAVVQLGDCPSKIVHASKLKQPQGVQLSMLQSCLSIAKQTAKAAAFGCQCHSLIVMHVYCNGSFINP
jgi:hypothetical protein